MKLINTIFVLFVLLLIIIVGNSDSSEHDNENKGNRKVIVGTMSLDYTCGKIDERNRTWEELIRYKTDEKGWKIKDDLKYDTNFEDSYDCNGYNCTNVTSYYESKKPRHWIKCVGIIKNGEERCSCILTECTVLDNNVVDSKENEEEDELTNITMPQFIFD